MTISTEKQYANKWAELLGVLGYRCTSSKRNIKNNICRTGTNEQEGKLWLLHLMLCVEIWWTGNSRRYGIKNMALIFKNMTTLPSIMKLQQLVQN